MNHFKADTITPREMGQIAESLRVARERIITLRWACQAGHYNPAQASKLTNDILEKIFLPVPVLTLPVKRSPQADKVENK